MTIKNFIRKYNGWLGFVIASVAFFVVPHVYHQFDETAGQFDAGYIHPIILGAVIICFASGLAWTLLLLTAPGAHKHLDKFFECGPEEIDQVPGSSSGVVYAFILYLVYFITTLITIWLLV